MARIGGLCGRGVDRMACGFDHALALPRGGGAFALGGNRFGQASRFDQYLAGI